MCFVIESENCLSAWKDAVTHILANGNGYNLMVKIIHPLNFDQNQLDEIVVPNHLSQAAIQDVINTLFPYKFFNRNNHLPIEQFYDLHETLYYKGKRIHSKNRTRWGNYFLRFTRFGANRENQLQNIITQINNRPNKQSACYTMHTSSVDCDSNTRIIGSPCLQYVQFAQVEDRINLTAIYRNHDFLKKALGNYIGLSRLLEFVCLKTGSQCGSVTCHSIHFYLDQKTRVRDCINGLTW